MKYKVEVIADASGEWVGNQLVFKTRDEAEQYGRDLFGRWTAVREWRVVEEPGRKGWDPRQEGESMGAHNPRHGYPTNIDRAGWAHEALKRFAEITRVGDESLETQMGDLMGDLMHLARLENVDFEKALERGRDYFEAELKGDE